MAGNNDYQDTALRRVLDTLNGPGFEEAKKFSTQQVLGHVQAAQRWFFDSLIEAGIDRVRTSVDVTIAAETTSWSGNQGFVSSTDFFRTPIAVLERANGTTGDWLAMTQSPIPPNAPVTTLRYWWDYYQGVLHFNAATQSSALRIWYYTDTSDLRLPYDSIVVKGMVDPISNYATALALIPINGSAAQTFMNLANDSLKRWINMEIHVMQQTPARQYRPGPQNWLYNYWL